MYEINIFYVFIYDVIYRLKQRSRDTHFKKITKTVVADNTIKKHIIF